MGIKRKKLNPWKDRPANEISEDEVASVLSAIQSFDGYPKLRQLQAAVPDIKPFKLNLVVRFLERNGAIIIDGDGNIVWTRGARLGMQSLSDIAELSPEFKDLLRRSSD